jgi:hypothetical protein
LLILLNWTRFVEHECPLGISKSPPLSRNLTQMNYSLHPDKILMQFKIWCFHGGDYNMAPCGSCIVNIPLRRASVVSYC